MYLPIFREVPQVLPPRFFFLTALVGWVIVIGEQVFTYES